MAKYFVDFEKTDGSTDTIELDIPDGVDGEKGDTGETGETGADGVGIKSIKVRTE